MSKQLILMHSAHYPPLVATLLSENSNPNDAIDYENVYIEQVYKV